jgi:hypothetical protein
VPTQFLRVVFPTDRLVYVNGRKTGRTNETLRVGEGTQLVDLGPRRNYQPAQKVVTMRRTTGENPLEVRFRRKPQT